MRLTLLLFILVTYLIAVVEGEESGKCKLSDKKLKKQSKTFEKKCLKKGFKTSIVGCESTGNQDDMKKRRVKKCTKIEKNLNACGFDCQEEGDWSECSVACGGGTMIKDLGKGKTEEKPCNENPCPVNGGYSEWSAWSECTKKCEGGTQSRSRACDNPASLFGGADCLGQGLGPADQTRECNKQSCKVKYTITHTTGKNTHDGGKTTGGYLFTLTGSDGKTASYDCPADRSLGATASCSFEDPVQIGTVKGMTVENISDNTWRFVSVTVAVNGVKKARWNGLKSIDDYATRAIVFTPLGDMVEYEITHRTGTGQWDEGGRTGYKFSFKGDGPHFTDWHVCEADRRLGKTGTCVIRDRAIIGKPTAVRIKNTGNNFWLFKTFVVKVNGKVVVNWSGTTKVPDMKTITLAF